MVISSRTQYGLFKRLKSQEFYIMSIKTLLLQRSLIFQFQFTKFKGIVGVNQVLKGDEETKLCNKRILSFLLFIVKSLKGSTFCLVTLVFGDAYFN